MTDFQQLAELYLDDREQLSDEQLAALVVHLRRAPELAEQFKEQLLLGELLGQKLAVDRAYFAAQVDQRIHDFQQGHRELKRQAKDLRQIARNQLVSPPEKRHWRTTVVWCGIAATLLVAVGVTFMSMPKRSVATVESVTGEARLQRGLARLPLTAGAEIRRGDRIVTDTASVSLRYPDGTVVRLEAGTDAAFDDARAGGKQMRIDAGRLSAKVAKQPAGQPMIFSTPTAEATVLGTELFLLVRPDSTRLDVTEGSVELARNDQQRAIVKANYYGVATRRTLAVNPIVWPINPLGLVAQFKIGPGGELVIRSETANGRTFRVEPRGGARLDENHNMALGRDGFFLAPEIDQLLLGACRQTNELTIEAIVKPANLDQTSTIVSLAGDATRFNFVLGQQRDQLVLRLNTSAAGGEKPAEVVICRLPDKQPHHVIVAYRAGRTVCYLDGEPVTDDATMAGDFSGWQSHPLTFGGLSEGQSNWSGILSGVAIYNRFLSDDEARQNAAQIRALSVRTSATAPR